MNASYFYVDGNWIKIDIEKELPKEEQDNCWDDYFGRITKQYSYVGDDTISVTIHKFKEKNMLVVEIFWDDNHEFFVTESMMIALDVMNKYMPLITVNSITALSDKVDIIVEQFAVNSMVTGQISHG